MKHRPKDHIDQLSVPLNAFLRKEFLAKKISTKYFWLNVIRPNELILYMSNVHTYILYIGTYLHYYRYVHIIFF